jgi:hypothetical protein
MRLVLRIARLLFGSDRIADAASDRNHRDKRQTFEEIHVGLRKHGLTGFMQLLCTNCIPRDAAIFDVAQPRG